MATQIGVSAHFKELRDDVGLTVVDRADQGRQPLPGSPLIQGFDVVRMGEQQVEHLALVAVGGPLDGAEQGRAIRVVQKIDRGAFFEKSPYDVNGPERRMARQLAPAPDLIVDGANADALIA